MTLDEYLARPDAPSLTDLATAMEVSKGRLSQLRGSVEWPPEIALKAEEKTGGALSASFLSPIIAQARRAAA